MAEGRSAKLGQAIDAISQSTQFLDLRASMHSLSLSFSSLSYLKLASFIIKKARQRRPAREKNGQKSTSLTSFSSFLLYPFSIAASAPKLVPLSLHLLHHHHHHLLLLLSVLLISPQVPLEKLKLKSIFIVSKSYKRYAYTHTLVHSYTHTLTHPLSTRSYTYKTH